MRHLRKVTKNGAAPRDISELKTVRQLNVWPMLIMLIAVLFLIVWFGGYLR